MTPTALQTLATAAPARTDPARRAAPGDEPANFAAVLDGSVQALSGDGEDAAGGADEPAGIEAREEGGGDVAGLPQIGVEATALAGGQPRLDALALMLAAAPAPPDRAAPGVAAAATAAAAAAAAGAATAAAAATAAGEPIAAAGVPAVAAQAAAASGAAVPLPAQALAAHPNDADGAGAVPTLAGRIEPDAATDPARAAAAASPLGAQRRESHAPAARPPQVVAIAAADDATGPGAAANPRGAAAAAPATTLAVAMGTQNATDAAPAALGQAAPAPTGATPPAARRLGGDAERGPVPASATGALQAGPVARQDASPTPAEPPPGIDLPTPAAAVAAASAPAAPGAVAHLAPAVGSPDWAPALAQQLVRLPGGGAVELHLNPVELGPLHVKLTMVEGQAQVQFVAEHAAVRQALEAALPQLRTSFAENGISLGHANVGSGAGEQRAGQDGGERPAPGSEREARSPADEPAATAGPRRPRLPAARSGAVDTFA